MADNAAMQYILTGKVDPKIMIVSGATSFVCAEGIRNAAKVVTPKSLAATATKAQGFQASEMGADEVGNAATRQTGTYKELLDAGANDSHHIIQDATIRDIPGYNRMKAPAVQLEGPAREIGTPHYNATQAQRSTVGGGMYGSERRIGYRSLREAGLSVDEAKATIRGADRYFMDELGLGLDSPTRMPGNRTMGR